MDYNAQITKNHFDRLNNYRNTKEFVEYARFVWYKESDIPQGELPSLLHDRWEIDEEIYDHFLEVLPPMGFRNDSFYMCEYTFDNITAKFTQEGDRFYCEFCRYDGF